MLEGNGGTDADDANDALNATAGDDGEAGDNGDDDDDGVEYVGMASNVSYLAPILRMFAMLHSFTAIAMMIGYYYLKVWFHSSILLCKEIIICYFYSLYVRHAPHIRHRDWILLLSQGLIPLLDFIMHRNKEMIICYCCNVGGVGAACRLNRSLASAVDNKRLISVAMVASGILSLHNVYLGFFIF